MKKKNSYELPANFLDEDFELFEPREAGIQKNIQKISEQTEYRIVQPCNIEIFSLISSRNGSDYFEVIKISPNYTNLRLFMPQDLNQLYFSKKNQNSGCMSLLKLKKAGMTEKQIDEIEAAGFFLQYKLERGYITLIPSKSFLATLCKQLGIGKLNSGIDPIRDIYLASRLRYADDFTLIYRTAGAYGKAFACFSTKVACIPQTVLFDYKKYLSEKVGTMIKKWRYTHFTTEIDLSFNQMEINLNRKAKITPGVRLKFSDVGDCAFSLQNALYINGGAILLNDLISKKRSHKLDTKEMVEEYYTKIYPKLVSAVQKLENFENIKVPDKKQAAFQILNKLDFIAIFGTIYGKEVMENCISKLNGSGTLLDVILAILKIPGTVMTDYRPSAIDRLNVSIGRIFELDYNKLLSC